MNKILSPITNRSNVDFECKLDTNIIINKYQQDYNLDVSSYFDGVDDIKIYRCLATKYRFYYPFGLAGDADFYAELQSKTDYYPQWKWENEIALQTIRKNDKVLEIGCGAGMFLSKLKSENIESVGLEFNKRAIISCQKQSLEVYEKNITEYADLYPEGFDIVCHFQVFEHIEKPREFLLSCLKLLKRNGKLIIGVPNNNPFLYKNDVYHTLNLPPHHVGLWNKESLYNLSKHFKMKIESIKTEPLYDYNYYFSLNYPKYKNILVRIVNRFSFLTKVIEGRNLVAIFRKN